MLNNTLKGITQKVFREYFKWNYRSLSATTTTDTPAGEVQNADEYRLSQTTIDETIALQPLLSSVTKEMWEKSHQVFINHGLPTKDFLTIVTKNPRVCSRSPEQNVASMENWRSCQFGEKLLHILLTTYPELLNVTNERKLLQRITFLKGFASTNKNVWKLLMSYPKLLEEREQSIEEKMNYLLHTMRIEIHEIVKSQALTKSLKDIRCRHVFLKRLDLFTPRSLKEDARQPTKNPRLHEITDTSDTNFAINTAHVSLEEYEVFKELFTKELKRKEQELSEEDDDESDEENNKSYSK